MSEAMKPTPGPWSVFEHSWCETSISAPSTDNAICLLDINHATEESQEADEAQMAANARLIAEAGTVFHETQCTPRQLAERVKELEEALRALVAYDESDHEDGVQMMLDYAHMLKGAYAALSKTLPNTVAEAQP